MLTYQEQHEILKLAKSLARAHVAAYKFKQAAPLLGDSPSKARKLIEPAETRLTDYLKEVG